MTPPVTPTTQSIVLQPGERIDELQRNGYRIIQRPGAFCFGMDAVLLSGFATSAVRKRDTVLDLCTGTGILPILLEAKTAGRKYYGVEIQEEMAEMAARSVRLNGLAEKIEILHGDLRVLLQKQTGAAESTSVLPILQELCGQVDVVTCNPPYMKAQHGLTNPDPALAIARHEVCCTLTDVCLTAARLLHPGGRFCMVHRPQRLTEILAALTAVHLEPKRLKLVHPMADKEANMVLIEAVRDGRSGCRVEKPLIVYQAPGKYTDEIYEIYGY